MSATEREDNRSGHEHRPGQDSTPDADRKSPVDTTEAGVAGESREGSRTSNTDPCATYQVDGSGYYLIKKLPRKDGRKADPTSTSKEGWVQLTNFVVLITGQKIYDDGEGDAHVRREYLITAATAGRACSFTLPAEQFSDVRRWVDTYIGAPATILPSVTNYLDHVAAAIKLRSGSPPTTHIRTHTGWTSSAGVRGFLHQGGVILPSPVGRSQTSSPSDREAERPGATPQMINDFGSPGPSGPSCGPVDALRNHQAQLSTQLRKFDLPIPLEGDELQAGCEAVYDLVDAGPQTVGMALLGLCFSAPLGGNKTYVNLIGTTDSGKSVFAALFQSFYGRDMNEKNFPAHWGATANFLERLLYHAKDVMVVIDDFLTKGQLSEIQRQQAKADQVLRALFNNNGRGRACGDGEIRAEKPPRAHVVSTAELPFEGTSIRNRGFNLDFQRKELDWTAITVAQENARRGIFAGVMSSYLTSIAEKYDQIQAWRSQREMELVKLARTELAGRGRVADVVASLMIGIEAYLGFVHARKLITREAFRDNRKLGWDALLEAARAQGIEQGDPVEFFFVCLQTAFVTGRAHLKGTEGGCPIREGDWAMDPDAWGWHRWSTEDQVKTYGDEDDPATTRKVAVTTGWKPRGEPIGWMNGTSIYLHPTASLRAAKAIARGLDATIDFNAWTLGKTLFERGLLLRSERSRDRYTTRENLGGGRPNVLMIDSSHIMPMKSAYPSECRLYDCEDHEIAEVMKSFEGLIA